MAFSSIFKKASNLLGFTSPTNLKPPPLDGEIIYCKNNVCVHPPATLTTDKMEHHQGYLTLRSTNDKVAGPTLILTWIPNSTLKKNTRSIENSPNRSHGATPKSSPRRAPRQEFSKTENSVTTPTTCMTDLSPMDSCVSIGSDFGEKSPQNAAKKEMSIDSNSDSVGSKEESLESFTQDDESQRKLNGASNGSNSGIASFGDEFVQNNEKCISNLNKDKRVGQHVNDLYVEKVSKINTELNNLTKLALEDDITVSKQKSLEGSDIHQNELNTQKKQRTSSSKSISIEMDGDSLCVTTEELDDEVLLNEKSLSSEQSVDSISECGNEYSNNNPPDRCSEGQSGNSINGNESSSAEYSEDISSGNHLTQNGIIGSDSQSTEDNTVKSPQTVPPHPQSLDLCAINTTADTAGLIEDDSMAPNISITRRRYSSDSSTTTSGPDSDPPSPYSSSPSSSQLEPVIYLDTPSSPESLSHNLQFPENAVSSKKDRDKKSAKEQICGVFSVDLGQMRSLRVFYSDPDNTIGQIVIASRESQYKILHFHHGGLDKLAEIFQDWSLFATHQDKVNETDKHYKQFMIVKPSITDDQCDPEEGVYSMVTEDIWQTHLMDDGVIEDDYQIRKAIFFGGLERCLRHEVWPFLLHYYPFDSTFEDREQIRNDKYIEYQNIRKKRESMSEEEQETFWRNVQCTVEKDVVRTDRSHPYFKGENNPNIEVLKNILLNYAVENPRFGYTQGMSDLLAPVLAEIQKEVDAYWCFTGLMQKTIFVSSPKDCDMDKQLLYLRELLRLMQPTFHEHLVHLGDDAMELLFAHRWILLCFKREFNEKAALRIWEACWSHYQTDYFHLFICVAIVSIYGEDVVEQCLPADEILLHFSSLACHMSGELVLRKARGLLHEYRRRPVIPCTLHGLCSQCGQGMWDSGHVPTVECAGNHLNAECPYLSPVNSPEPDNWSKMTQVSDSGPSWPSCFVLLVRGITQKVLKISTLNFIGRICKLHLIYVSSGIVLTFRELELVNGFAISKEPLLLAAPFQTFILKGGLVNFENSPVSEVCERMASQNEDIGQLTQHLGEMEIVAEDILTDRQQIIDLDRKRQKTREAVRVLSKDKKSKKQWVCFGDMFIKFPSDKTKKMLEQDFDQLDNEIGDLRRNLKPKVNKLRDLEMKEDIKGFNLNPLSREELKTVEGYCN